MERVVRLGSVQCSEITHLKFSNLCKRLVCGSKIQVQAVNNNQHEERFSIFILTGLFFLFFPTNGKLAFSRSLNFCGFPVVLCFGGLYQRLQIHSS